MKVLYIADQYSEGGAAKALIEMITLLRDRHGVKPIVGTAFNNALADELDRYQIPHVKLGHRQFAFNYNPKRGLLKLAILRLLYWLRYYIANRKALRVADELIKIEKIDIIHSNVDRNDIGCLIARKYNIPHIWHIREFTKGHFNLVFNSLMPFYRMNHLTNKFVCISNAVGEEWRCRGINNNKINVIYDGIDVDNYDVKNKYFNNDLVRIICVGEITKSKGQWLLIEALHNIFKKGYFFHLDFYGNGEKKYIDKLQNTINSYGLKEMISFKGYENNISDIITTYDIGVNPSSGEGFGRTTIEYMSSGLITIIKKNSLSIELIGDDKFGYSFTDEESLANIIIWVLKNKKEAIKIARDGSTVARERFDINKNIEQFYNLYKNIIYNYNI